MKQFTTVHSFSKYMYKVPAARFIKKQKHPILCSAVYFVHTLFIASLFDFLYNSVCHRTCFATLWFVEWPFETVPLLHKIIITYELEVPAVFDMIVCICQVHSCKPSYKLTERTDENQSGDVPKSLFYVQCQQLILLTWQVCRCRGNLEGPPQNMESTICGEGKRHVFDNHMTRDSFTSNITKPSEDNYVLVASAKYNIHLKTLPLKVWGLNLRNYR